MPRKLILDGNTVYELDEECMLQHKSSAREETLASRMNKEDEEKAQKRQKDR